MSTSIVASSYPYKRLESCLHLSSSPTDSLPDDLLLHIFAYLRFFNLMRTSLVSHRWRYLALYALEHSSTLPHKGERIIRRISELCKHLHPLRSAMFDTARYSKKEDVFPSLLEQVLKTDGHGPYLNELRLRLSGTIMGLETLQHLCLCTALRRLEVHHLHVQDTKKCIIDLPQLQSLELAVSHFPSTVHWNVPLLTKIDFYMVHFSEETLSLLLTQSRTTLNSLCLYPTPVFSKKILTCLQKITALKELYLNLSLVEDSLSEPASTEDYAHFFSNQSQLTHLSVSGGARLLLPSVVRAIAQHDASLLHLDLNFINDTAPFLTTEFNYKDLIENNVLSNLQSLSLETEKLQEKGVSSGTHNIIIDHDNVRSTLAQEHPLFHEARKIADAFPGTYIHYMISYYSILTIHTG